jgi:FtsH-binding integral membrane protein
MLLLLVCCAAAGADPVKHPANHFVNAFTDKVALGWLVGSIILCYVLAVGMTTAFSGVGYPPTVARISLWVAAMIWTLIVVFWIFAHVLAIIMKPWFFFVVFVALLLFAVILAAARQRINAA